MSKYIKCCIDEDNRCNADHCATCGFNPEEHKRRMATLRNEGFTRGENGLRYIKVHRPTPESEPSSEEAVSA